MPSYRTVDIEVEGGALHAGVWGNSGPVLLCSHGITANHLSFSLLAELLGDHCQLIAPDHRGRGGSRHIQGPWGMKAHAADVIALLDALDIECADVMVGHSMGGFVSVVAQAQYPERIASLVLVDGGLPLADEIPTGITPEQLIQAVIGPAMERLDMRFESVQAYYDFWKQHPAFAEASIWSPQLERYLAHDLCGESQALKAAINKAAIVGDVESQLMSDEVPAAIAALSCPVHFLQAPRGIMNDAPLYPLERLELFKERIANFEYRQVSDVNHYSILLQKSGSKAVAETVETLLANAR